MISPRPSLLACSARESSKKVSAPIHHVHTPHMPRRTHTRTQTRKRKHTHTHSSLSLVLVILCRDLSMLRCEDVQGVDSRERRQLGDHGLEEVQPGQEAPGEGYPLTPRLHGLIKPPLVQGHAGHQRPSMFSCVESIFNFVWPQNTTVNRFYT